MKLPRTGVMAAVLFSLICAGSGADLKNRSTSASGQFVIYCDDRELRGRVVMFVDETKERVLKLLRERDDWDFPVVMTLDRAVPGKTEPGVDLSLVQTVGGGKVELNVRIGDDPARIFLQKHVIRAVLIEMAYRDRPAVNGKRIVDAPWWLVEGIIQSFRRRDGELNADVFKSIADRSKLPALEKFVMQPPVMLSGFSGEVDRACAMCLVEALLGLPNGPENLGRLVKEWPDVSTDPMGALARHFPVLAESSKSLAKWWSLQLARFADSERWQGLSLEESEKEFAGILALQIAVDKTGRTEKYALSDFEKFIAMPGAKQTLRAAQVRLVTFSARANPLFRPIVNDYEQIVSALISGKTKEVAKKLADTEAYRAKLIQRMALITDYLNWYEATNPQAQAGVFDSYLRAVKDAEPKPPAPVDPRIAEYLDSLEKEFEPVLPNPPDPTKGAVMR
jgi:hypothetical protein